MHALAHLHAHAHTRARAHTHAHTQAEADLADLDKQIADKQKLLAAMSEQV